MSERTLGQLCQEPGNTTFGVSMNKLTGLNKTPIELTNSIPAQRVKKALEDSPKLIPEEYWEFMDVFSGEKANMLVPH